IAIAVTATLSVLTLLAVRWTGIRVKAGWHLIIAVAAFALLGFVTGSTMSDSREPSVAAVLPAVLTLMGGAAAFLIGTKGIENQTSVSALILNFSLALYIGSFYGAELRELQEISLDYNLAIEKNRHTVELARLVNYVEFLKLKKEIEEQQHLDLSHFQSASEKRLDNKAAKE
ncbi:MAG: hypothetical protein ACREDY_20390, partial [Bradyrhizobium sp.]